MPGIRALWGEIQATSLRSQDRRAQPIAKRAEDIIARMFRWIAFLMILCSGAAYGAVKQVPIKSGVVLKPGEAYTAQVESAKEVEIGWTAAQAKSCATDCIPMTVGRDMHSVAFTAAPGA